MPECRSCGAPIIWAATAAGRPAPLDRDPVEQGNVHVYSDGPARRCATLAGAVLDEARDDGVPLRMNHFATCPSAARHRPKADAA